MFPFPGILEDVKRFHESLTVHLNHKDTQVLNNANKLMQIEFNIEEAKKQISKNEDIVNKNKNWENLQFKDRIEKINSETPPLDELIYFSSKKKSLRTLRQGVVLERSQSITQQDISSLLNKNKRRYRNLSFDINLMPSSKKFASKLNPPDCLASKNSKPMMSKT